MTTSVVGLFDSISQAQVVSQELGADGIGHDEIQVLANDASSEAHDSAAGKGFFARVGELLGITSDDTTGRHYHEGLRRGGVLVVVKTSEAQVDHVVTVMLRHGAVDVNERAEQWQKERATSDTDTDTRPTEEAVRPAETVVPAAVVPAVAAVKTAVHTQAASATAPAQSEVALPVIEEELRVGKRVVQRGGVRVYTNVTERPVEERIRLREEHVRVERHPVDRPVTDADLRTFQQGTIEITERAEEAVVSKQARIVEEVVVSKQVAERTESVRDTVRRTDVEVEELPAGIAPFETYSDDFQRHFTTNFGTAGGTFEQYTPAYRYGLGLAADTRHRGADWSTLEIDARRGWEEHQPGTWERFKDAIKYAWESVRNKVKNAAA